MKILFICSSLEPGRDGAGDQTRVLAGELIRQGHQAVAISLNDFNVTEPTEALQYVQETPIRTLRLPATLEVDKRYAHLSDFINQVNPSWVSLQFVNFGFHKYGLPWHLLRRLRPAIGKAKLHIMLWELWCGMGAGILEKVKLLGISQKAFLRLMLSVLKPDSLSTSTTKYAVDLKRIGVKAGLIHVFSNIPLDEQGCDNDWQEFINQSNLVAVSNHPDEWLVLGFFGSVYPCLGLEQLLQTAAEAATMLGRRLGVISIGLGRGQDVGSLVSDIPGAFYWKTGALSPAMVNRVMQIVDLGVVTTPAVALTKSSTAIAWHERGVPIIISGRDNTYDKSNVDYQGVFQITSPVDMIESFAAKNHLIPKRPLQEVAATYIGLNDSHQ